MAILHCAVLLVCALPAFGQDADPPESAPTADPAEVDEAAPSDGDDPEGSAESIDEAPGDTGIDETPAPTDDAVADVGRADGSGLELEDLELPPPVMGGDLHRELRTVEEQVSDLKERVFRSKATLELLKELVLDTAASGSRVVLWHINELGAGYSVESVQYFLDGKSVYSRVETEGALDEEREIKLHEQSLTPGTHQLQVNLVLRGKGYKIFSYLRDYEFKVQSSYTFKVEEGKTSLIRVVVDSLGGLRKFVERPTVQYEERKISFGEE